MRVVIFDMDGTIIDSAKAIEKTINGIRARLNLEPLSTEFIVKAINEPGRNLALEFYGMNSPSGSLKAGFEADFKTNYDLYATTYDGIKELLEKFRANGDKIALASNAPAKTLEQILKRNEIFELFDLVVGADENIPQKPDPTMLIIVKEKLNANKAVFVGDSLKDEGAAINAKMPYIHVTWGFGTSADKSSFIANKPSEIYDIVVNKI